MTAALAAITAGLSGWELAWLALGALGVLLLAGTAVVTAGILIGSLIVTAARWLCGAGDGTPGRRRLRQAVADVDREHRAATRQLPLAGLVISPEVERYAAHLASRPTEAISPGPADGCAWCVPPHAWPCTCTAQCGDPACLAGVRNG